MELHGYIHDRPIHVCSNTLCCFFSGLGGIWKLKLLPEVNPGPYSITARSTEGEITINDVMFGDVWICSGQSNMQFTMKQVLPVLFYS